MGKISKKLIVYLDQNFISEMAKGKSSTKISPLFHDIYEQLHKGFLAEKLVVPRSFFHEEETSLIPSLKSEIQKLQGYIGQIELHDANEILNFQLSHNAKLFLGITPEKINYKSILRQDPDKRVRQFDVIGNIDWNFARFRERRINTSSHLESIHKNIISKGVSYKQQYEEELLTRAEDVLNNNRYGIDHLFSDPKKSLEQFVESKYFRDTPFINIFSRIWAKLLTHFPNREIRSSDMTDVNLISAFLPYVDVLAIDSFMGNIINSIKFHELYNTLIFTSSYSGLKAFKTYIDNFLQTSISVNTPLISIFVLSDNKIKENSWSFFQELGRQVTKAENHRNIWIEIFAFDDGSMPSYFFPGPNVTFPFYGIQEVHVISGIETKDLSIVLDLCNNKVRSNKFVLINSYLELRDDFIDKLISHAQSGKNKISKFKIY